MSPLSSRRFLLSDAIFDLHLDSENGVVTGPGSFRIKRPKGKYEAFFTELTGDGGAYAQTVRIRNLKVNKATRTVFFDIVLYDGRDSVRLRRVAGRISRGGIKTD